MAYAFKGDEYIFPCNCSLTGGKSVGLIFFIHNENGECSEIIKYFPLLSVLAELFVKKLPTLNEQLLFI